jgi:hypothetical protein
MFQGDTWILVVPDPAVVGIDLATCTKRAVATEYYKIQKCLVSDETFAYRVPYKPPYLHPLRC